MDRKVKSVLVAFFAAVMIGTGIVLAQTYKIPSSGYSTLGIMAVLNQNQAPTANFQGTKNSEFTQYTTDTGSLNLIQTQVTKESVQNQINNGFRAWMLKSPERLMRSFNADNETISSLFYQFLSENPEYRELFRQYDQLLSEEMQASMLKQAEETFKYVYLLLSEGEVVREWNTTNTINNTTYTYVFKDYTLDINGTTQHIIKVSVYASDGTLISDPYINIINAPLIYWVWWWGWWPVLYGWEYGAYQHYTAGAETVTFLAAAWSALQGADDFTDIGAIIGVIVAICCCFGGFPAAVVGAATAAILAGIGFAVRDMAEKTWEAINYVNILNSLDTEHPNFGFMLYQNFHWIASTPPWWDPLSYTKFCLIESTGVVYQVWPLSGVCYMSIESVSAYIQFMSWYNLYVGMNQWVWVSPA